jgi:hypothetical protein
MSVATLILGRMDTVEQVPRNADGTLPTGEQLYWQLVESQPHVIWTPERRAQARDEAYALAARYQRLAQSAV